MGLKIGFCGAGGFVGAFIPLFKAHPLVEKIAIADLVPERVEKRAREFEIADTYRSLDELCKSDVDAICIFTQRWSHGPMAIQALRAGKHVYSAVPMGVSVDECGEIVRLVEQTGLIYMLGETSYYYPSTLYCRSRYQAGDFGHITYGEAQYYHDMSHGFYDVYKRTGGENWKATASVPPMLYPTHSLSMILSVIGGHMTHVSCLGWKDRGSDDGVFDRDVSLWQNHFSNESALMRHSDGSMHRINEFRRVGWNSGVSVHLSLYGTEASYEEQATAQSWVTKPWGQTTDLRSLLKCGPETMKRASELLTEVERADFHCGMAAVHPRNRLPESFKAQSNGHLGSHQFLVDDFVQALHHRRHPPCHAWAAARYNLPGIVAHESAKRDGERLPIPDFGSGPA